MNGLQIGPDDPSGQGMVTVLTVQGPGMADPFRGACYQASGSAGETIEEMIDLQMEGRPADISAGLADLQERLDLAKRYSLTGIGVQMFLLARPEAEEAIWRSPLICGWLEILRGQTAQRSLAIRLHLTRRNYWEGSETLIPLSNPHGVRVTDLLRVDNHNDGDHWNYAEIDPVDLAGDLPAPFRLQMNGDPGTVTGWIGQIYVGLNANVHPGDAINHWLEGEEAANGVNLSSTVCSNEAYKSVSWTGTEEIELMWWTLDRSVMGLGDGRYYRPLIRFYPAPTQGDLWVKLRIQSGTTPIWEAPWQLIEAGAELQELNTLQLPPYLVNQNFLKPLYLMLLGRQSGSEEHTLAVDYIQFTPLDGWRKLVTRGRGMGGDGVLEDDGFQNVVYLNDLGEYHTDYMAYGAPPLLNPGHLHRLYLLAMNRDTLAAETGRGFLLRLYTRPRKRFL